MCVYIAIFNKILSNGSRGSKPKAKGHAAMIYAKSPTASYEGMKPTKRIVVHKGSGRDKGFFVLAHNAMVIAFMVKRIRDKG